MKTSPDTFSLYARWLPALIAVIPLLAIWYFLAANLDISGLTNYVIQFKILGGISVGFALIYLFTYIIRDTSKYFEKKYFLGKDGFPSTYFMLYANETYPKQVKKQFREKVKNEFDLKLSTEVEESNNKTEAVKLLNHASRLISTKYIGEPQIKRMNLHYSFFRNLAGGSMYGILFSISGLLIGLFSERKQFELIFGALLVFYFILFGVKKQLIIKNGEAYANKLISVFLSNK